MGKFLLDESQIKKITEIKGGCMASNRITVDGEKVGYMYREEPSENFADTGWRFFAGDEPEEYCNNSNNFNIFEVNTICNYDDAIVSKLNAPIGTAFVRTSSGELIQEVIKE